MTDNHRTAQNDEPRSLEIGEKILLLTQELAKTGFLKIPPLRGQKGEIEKSGEFCFISAAVHGRSVKFQKTNLLKNS